jgi:signal peptide peptidase SppA
MAAVYDTPWAITQAKLDEITDLLELRRSGHLGEEEIQNRLAALGPDRPREGDDEPYRLIGGVAVVPLYGVLAPRMNIVMRISGGTSTQQFVAAVNQAVDDPDVKAIVIDIDSPGGSVLGLPEAADAVRQASTVKPIVSVATGQMCSAAYYVGSAAGEVIATRSSQVGSIGTIGFHCNHQAADLKEGVEKTVIFAGPHKADGSTHAPLNDQGRATLQEQVDAYYAQFVTDVARFRGITPAAVENRFGGGKHFIAAEALTRGLIDRIATLSEVVAELDSAGSSTNEPTFSALGKDITMNPILEQLIKMGLIAADANDTAQAAQLQKMGILADVNDTAARAIIGGWYGAQGRTVPTGEKADAQILADLEAGPVRAPAAIAPEPVRHSAGTGTPMTPVAGNQITSAQIVGIVESTPALDASAIAAAERQRIADIQASAELLAGDDIDPDFIQGHVDAGTDLNAFRKQLVEHVGKRRNTPGNGRPVGPIPAGASADRFGEAAVEALLHQAGQASGEMSQGARELRYHGLLEMARESFRVRGIRGAGSPDDFARAALGDPEALRILGADQPYQTPGDFPNILSNLANKSLEAPPEYVSTTYQFWAHKRSPLADFKPATLIRVGEFGLFPEHIDGDDFEQSKLATDRAWIKIDGYGDEFGLTPQMIIDDDLDAFMTALKDKRAAHDHTLNALCVDLLTGNVPVVDGIDLFDSEDHGNDITSGAAPTTTQLSAMRLTLRKQTGVGGQRKLNQTLGRLLIPEDLETTTQQLLAATLSITPHVETETPVFKGSVDWHVEPRLADHSTAKYYGFSKGSRAIVYAHQRGFENMVTRNYFNPKNNCRTWQFEGRFAAAVNNYREIVRNAGE